MLDDEMDRWAASRAVPHGYSFMRIIAVKHGLSQRRCAVRSAQHALFACALVWAALCACVPHARAAMLNEPLHQGLRYEDSECLMCHSATVTGERSGRTYEPVDPDSLKHSVHKEIHCVQCHKGARLSKDRSHMTAITMVECKDCHYKGNDIGAPQKDVAEEYMQGVHGQSVLKDKASKAPRCWDCHTGHSIKKVSGGKKSVNRDRVVKVCKNCHYDSKIMGKYKLRTAFIAQYDNTPHARARQKGNDKAAICTDCHGNHNIKKRDDPGNPLKPAHVPETCAKCHKDVSEVYKKSIHGKGWLEGVKDAPVCTTCHGEHEIRYVKNPDATVYPTHVVSLCEDCHSNISIQREYGLRNTVETYKKSYHGIVNRLGRDVQVANCASCHGHHDILPSTDKTSRVNAANLGKTCGNCHEPAMLNSNIGKIHVAAEPGSSLILFYIKWIYIVMITGSIGGMLFYIFTDLFGFVTRRRRHILERIRRKEQESDDSAFHDPAGEHGHADPDLPDDMEVERWPRAYRIQHLLLITSFTMLVLTGMPLVFPDLSIFRLIARNEFLYELRGITHRAFGFLMIALCAYHVLFVAANRAARRDILNMIPKPRDARDAFQAVLYNLNLRREHPHMPRYNFIEKFEYLAMAWGSFVMIATGLVLTFNSFFLQYIPWIGFDIATLVHKFEAILATLAILIWHMYTVHLTPDFFPMNKVFFNGKISLGNLRKHHGEEYEQVAEELKRRTAGTVENDTDVRNGNGGGDS